MKLDLQSIAAARLAHRRVNPTGPVAEAQAGLWAALKRGNMPEALRHAAIVRSIRGPVPTSRTALAIIERLSRLRVPSVEPGIREQV